MRILSGQARGMNLLSPKGMATRPMVARVKEALFNILGDIEDCRVLDLFAGSGALGLEALSRGARECYFVEKGRHALPALEANIAKARFEKQSKICKRDVFSLFHHWEEGIFDIIFLDPPYRHLDEVILRRKFLAFLAEMAEKVCHAESVMVLHYRLHSMAGAHLPENLTVHDKRVYGSSELMFLGIDSRGT